MAIPFLAALLAKLGIEGGAAAAIGSTVAGTTAGIGTGVLGGGLLTQAGTVGLASGGAGGLTAGGLSSLVGSGGLGTTAGTGIAGGLAAEGIGATALGLGTKAAGSGFIETLAGTLSKEILGLDPEASMKENASNMAVKQVSNTMNKKEAPAPVNIDNSWQGKSPNIVQPKTSSGAQSIPPEMMQRLLQMMTDNKRTGRTTPIGSSIFSGGR